MASGKVWSAREGKLSRIEEINYNEQDIKWQFYGCGLVLPLNSTQANDLFCALYGLWCTQNMVHT